MEISVIIPTYKPQEYLQECLLSLSKQTLSLLKFEIILILNGQKEPYFTSINDNIKKNFLTNCLVIYTDRKGVSNARNIGIEQSRGEFICFIDDDDIISDNYLETLLETIKKTTKSIAVSNVYTFADNLKELGVDYLTKAYFDQTKNTLFNRRSFLSTSCCKIIPRQVIGDYRFNERFKRGEDALFMFSISCNIRKILKSTDDTIYYRRVRKNSTSRDKQNLFSRLKNMLYLIIAYTKIYIAKPTYNTKLYLSRIAATFINF